jgi:hypothetical protein
LVDAFGAARAAFPMRRPPVLTNIGVTPAFGIADLQPFAFTVTATDPDGDPLTYASTMQYPGVIARNGGRTATVTFFGGPGGPASAVVRASDGRETIGAWVTIHLGTMTGPWSILRGGSLAGAVLQLVQGPSRSIAGSMFRPGVGTYLITSTEPGQIRVDATVTLPMRSGSTMVTLNGTLESVGRLITAF